MIEITGEGSRHVKIRKHTGFVHGVFHDLRSCGKGQAETSIFPVHKTFILMKKPVMIVVGSLGSLEFPAGRYVYTGSAKRHIESRISRHLSKSKTLRWHIDYLLSRRGVKVAKVSLSDEPECILNQATTGEIVVPQFGASDCRSGCVSHLKFLGATEPEQSKGK